MLKNEERIAEVKRRTAEKKSVKKDCGGDGLPPFPAWRRVLR